MDLKVTLTDKTTEVDLDIAKDGGVKYHRHQNKVSKTDVFLTTPVKSIVRVIISQFYK